MLTCMRKCCYGSSKIMILPPMCIHMKNAVISLYACYRCLQVWESAVMALLKSWYFPQCVWKMLLYPSLVLPVFIGKADMGKALFQLLQLTICLDSKTARLCSHNTLTLMFSIQWMNSGKTTKHTLLTLLAYSHAILTSKFANMTTSEGKPDILLHARCVIMRVGSLEFLSCINLCCTLGLHNKVP